MHQNSVYALFQEWLHVYADARSSRDGGATLAVSVLAFTILVVAFLVFMSIRNRARIEAKRLDLLRELSAKGQLTQPILEQHLLPRHAWSSFLFAAAWFGLFAGVAMSVIGITNGWRRDYEAVGWIGVALLVLSLSTITAPIALREIRRQGT